MMTIATVIRWLIFNVVLALIPLLLNFALAYFLNIQDRWLKVLKGGELFIFSSTLAATAIGQRLVDMNSGLSRTVKASAIGNSPPLGTVAPVLPAVAIAALIVILVLASGLSALAAFSSLNGTELPKPKRIVNGSVACAVSSSILSFYLSVM